MVEIELFQLVGGGQRLVLASSSRAVPEQIYWGPDYGPLLASDVSALVRAVPHGQLDRGEVFDLLPEAGRGFSGWPALQCHGPQRDPISQCSLAQVETAEHGFLFTLRDERAGIAVAIDIAVDPETGVVSSKRSLCNEGTGALCVDWFASLVLTCPYSDFLQFSGRWTHEFEAHRTVLGAGILLTENRTGRTSHHAPPFLIAGDTGFDDGRGNVLGLHLGWSGNHRLLVERLRGGRVQIQAGALLLPGEMYLDASEVFSAPTAYACRADGGMNGLSARFHPFVRNSILRGRLNGKPRPVHFNTWEAIYFQHDEKSLDALVIEAAALGVERFVLDDGWFKGRNDDTAGLGDWAADLEKYPLGLGPLIASVNRHGMQFGLWVEPEMVNADSDLFRAHPDWILGVPGRDQPLGRGQYVLDLTRPEVADYIFAAIDTLLTNHPIAYLKWDMNRDLTHAISAGAHAAHQQTEAVYDLIDRVRTAHPAIEIESCASGGGRADYCILQRTDRIWTSDCNDPLDRQRIQKVFSVFFPPEVMGAHIGPRRSHTTGRVADLDVRAITAVFGHLGVEGDVRAFSEQERNALQTWMAFYKDHRDDLHSGTLTRLTHVDPGVIAFAVQGQATFVSITQTATPAFDALAPLLLPMLDATGVFEVSRVDTPHHPERAMKQVPSLARGEKTVISGAILKETGLPLPILRVGQATLFKLEPLV